MKPGCRSRQAVKPTYDPGNACESAQLDFMSDGLTYLRLSADDLYKAFGI